MPLDLIAAVLMAGVPAPQLQGDWHVVRIRTDNQWEMCLRVDRFAQGEHVWRVRGTWAESAIGEKKSISRIGIVPDLINIHGQRKCDVIYTDPSGRRYLGTFTTQGNQAIVVVGANVPIPGGDGFHSGQELTITLERPRPLPPAPLRFDQRSNRPNLNWANP